MIDIIKYYENHRIDSTDDIFNVTYLENLFYTDYKKLQFIMFYYYLKKHFIPLSVRSSNIVSTVIFSLVSSIDDDKLSGYYSTYFNLNEIKEQWFKIYNEIDSFATKNELYNKFKGGDV